MCSRVGSVNITCDQDTGHCYCREKFSGENCTVLEQGYYVPGVPEMTYEAEQVSAITVGLKLLSSHRKSQLAASAL